MKLSVWVQVEETGPSQYSNQISLTITDRDNNTTPKSPSSIAINHIILNLSWLGIIASHENRLTTIFQEILYHKS